MAEWSALSSAKSKVPSSAPAEGKILFEGISNLELNNICHFELN